MTKDTKYLILLTLLYFAVSLTGVLHHELWMDEAHHWLLARDSNSVSELIQNTRFEGHPLLWSLLLYGISKFTQDPFWMQFLHILISTSTVIIFLKKAPFDWLFKTLFLFGYFMVFEYNLISRNYNLGILFLFLGCIVFENRRQQFPLLCLYLALASNTHLMFSIISLALFFTLLLENIQDKLVFQKNYLTGYFIFGLGALLIYIQIHSTDSDWLLEPISRLSFQQRLVDGFVSFFKGIVAIPDFRTLHFWNSNLIVNWSKPMSGILALLIYFLPLLLFFKNRKILFFVYVALVGAQVFFFITQRGATRFHGMTFIIVIVALWIENYYTFEDYKFKDFLNSCKLTLLKKPIIYSFLLLQFCSGIYAYSMDYKYPFSAAKATADYLKREKLNNKQIVTVTCDGTLISAYLEKKVYFLYEGSYQSFCHWNSNCFGNISKKNTLALITSDQNLENESVYVSNYPLTEKMQPKVWQKISDRVKVRFLKKFDTSIVQKNNYFVYTISKN